MGSEYYLIWDPLRLRSACMGVSSAKEWQRWKIWKITIDNHRQHMIATPKYIGTHWRYITVYPVISLGLGLWTFFFGPPPGMGLGLWCLWHLVLGSPSQIYIYIYIECNRMYFSCRGEKRASMGRNVNGAFRFQFSLTPRFWSVVESYPLVI